METSLHQQIKRLVARDQDSMEVSVGNYRIDAIDSMGRLVEVQFGPLGALHRKVIDLRSDHVLRIIKPIIAEKRVITLHPKSHEVLRSRKSPKSEQPNSIFQELIHFTKSFPHPNLSIECWSVKINEYRFDRPRKRARKQYVVKDVTLQDKLHEFTLHSSADLPRLLGLSTSDCNQFCTKVLAEQLKVDRWFAQQIAYVLFNCGATVRCGKIGNSHLYEWHEDLLNKPSATAKRKRIAA